MKIKRTRTFYLDPHLRKRRLWCYGAFETHYSRHTGDPYDSLRATARTPAKAAIAARKTRKTRLPKEPNTWYDRNLRSRMVRSFEEKRRPSPADIRRIREYLNKKRAEQNG